MEGREACHKCSKAILWAWVSVVNGDAPGRVDVVDRFGKVKDFCCQVERNMIKNAEK